MTNEQHDAKAEAKTGDAVSAFRSVFVRSAAIMAVTTIVVAGVMAVQSTRLAENLARRNVIQNAEASAINESEALVNPMRFKAVAKIDEVVTNARGAAGEYGLGVVVIDAEGAILAEDTVDASLQTTLAGLAMQALDSDGVVTAGDNLYTARAVRAEPGQPPLGAIAVAFTDGPAMAHVMGEKISIALWALGIFAGMMVLTMVLLRRFLGIPLNNLGQAIARVSEGDYDSEISMVSRDDELGRIARHLHSLTTRLRIARQAEEERIEKQEAQVAVVRHLANGLDKLADGALNHEISERFPGEYEALRENFNRAVGTLRSAISNVSDNAGNILSSANEIARASDDLSQRTETQAATLEETAAALEEMLTTVQQAANRAKDANLSVRTVRETALNNGEVMQEAVGAMGAIEKSSEKIGEIITVIDDIAFQTNLLALNAGVEAARAGESGKGFAVVASEVRNLAQRSAEAAQQIKELIDDSTGQVKDGVHLVQRAGVALQDVVGQVATISDLMAEIAAGAGEQAEGLNEINSGVSNLDRVTQQNAAMVEQTTAAAHMLREDANELSGVVGKFVFVDETPSSAAILAETLDPDKTKAGRIEDAA
ncbi:methyl-accepting chemotaxis protein [Primorskyibacter sp. 2E107]|uniref:methyl-accepting chemotaxis protein n=1 Tax=Primorskyibacter sp. 2E107 TaxID=3403458 RepID=UPI003AF40E3A